MNLLDTIQHALLRVDDTEKYSPGQIVPIGDVDYMVIWVLNDNDLSLILHEPEVLH